MKIAKEQAGPVEVMAKLSVCNFLYHMGYLMLLVTIVTGHESGRHIVDILKRNHKKDADKYTDEDLQHMRKVVSYCKVI